MSELGELVGGIHWSLCLHPWSSTVSPQPSSLSDPGKMRLYRVTQNQSQSPQKDYKDLLKLHVCGTHTHIFHTLLITPLTLSFYLLLISLMSFLSVSSTNYACSHLRTIALLPLLPQIPKWLIPSLPSGHCECVCVYLCAHVTAFPFPAYCSL